MKRVLFVCTGNVCRSPMAMALFERQARQQDERDLWIVESAGTWAVDGQCATGYAQSMMAQRELNIGKHRARTITPADVENADIVIVMTQNHREALAAEFPQERHKLHLLGELDGKEDTWSGLDPKTVLGHMHLQIADVRRDQAFYRDVLGFDVMMNMGSASFVSAGGYHHHIGMNIWNSAGAPPPPPDAVGLRYFTVQLPNRDGLSKTIDRVRNAGVPVDETESGLLVRDPSQNSVVLTTK